MSNPPPPKGGRPRSILDSGSPRRTMVLRSQPAYISLTARRAQPAGPPPTQPTTPPRNPTRESEKFMPPPLTNVSPYQLAPSPATRDAWADPAGGALVSASCSWCSAYPNSCFHRSPPAPPRHELSCRRCAVAWRRACAGKRAGDLRTWKEGRKPPRPDLLQTPAAPCRLRRRAREGRPDQQYHLRDHPCG